VQGDSVPLPGRGVSPLYPLFSCPPPQAARKKDLKSYNETIKGSPL